MFVVALVAIDTGTGGIFESGREVTLLTGDDGMQANERELGQIVVEKYLLPTSF